MDRYRSNIARSAAAAGVAVFLVAGAAFAANAVFAPASPNAAPALTPTADYSTAAPTGAMLATDDTNPQGDDTTAGTAGTVEPNETAEPVENHQGADDAAAEPAETAEPFETAGAENHQGADDATAETTEPRETAEPAQTAEPTHAPGDDNGGHGGGNDD